MENKRFNLVYEGDAVDDGTMDIAHLAPALLAFNQYIKAANSIINGENFNIRVKVTSFEEGSFDINLLLDGDFIKNIKDWVTGDQFEAIKSIVSVTAGTVAVIGGGYKGVVWLIRKLKGQKPNSIERKDGKTIITLGDEKIEVIDAVAEVAFNRNARAALEKVIYEPLQNDGIKSVLLSANDNKELILKDEAHYFKVPLFIGDDLFETRSTMVFSYVNISFKQGNKWKLSTGIGSPINVTMEDENFQNRIDNSEVAFAKGDVFICTVKATATRSKGVMKTEYIIEKVQQHIPASNSGQSYLPL